VRCLGCNGTIPWDGKGTLCYTCPCGATIFYDENSGAPMIPTSLVIALQGDTLSRNMSHLDYYLGKSAFWSREKEEVCNFLRRKGAVWSWECPQCRDRTIQRARMEKEEGLYRFEHHPDLQKLVEENSTAARAGTER